jgi:hypothetical protein
MSKKTKVAPGKKATISTPASGGRRFYLWLVLILAVLGVLAYFWIGRKPGSGKVDLTEDSGSEPTLTAKKPLLQLLSPGETGIDFENQITEDATHNIFSNINQYNGGGVAVADINNDNLPDIYFISTSGKNRLYLNQGNFKFKDITDSAGVGSADGFETAVTAADVNADGWLDFFVSRAGPEPTGREARLFINNQNLTFTERAKEYGLADRSPASGANFFDADNDGDLDCYVINHPVNLDHANKLVLKYGADGKTLVPNLDPQVEHDSDNFYRNENGKFVNASKSAGIQNLGFGLSVSVSDINGDGWPDIYVGNDFVQPDNLYINNQKGGFTDQMSQHFRHNSMSAMGAELVDFDNDTRVDLLTVDMLPMTNYRQKLLKTTNDLSRYQSMVQYGYPRSVARNVLQRNNGNGTFSDIACLTGLYKTDWSWSCLLVDLDNDGWRDLHISNGYRREVTHRDYADFLLPEVNKLRADKSKNPLVFLEQLAEYKVRNVIYQNKGNWQFEEKSGDWMTMKGSWSSGGAWADFDADGDLDLVVNNLEDPAFVYKNLCVEEGRGRFLQAKLQGGPGNPFAVGASVLLEHQGTRQYQELNPNHGIFSSVEHLIHFGVGQTAQVDKLTVRWPDGKFQVLTNVPTNQRLQLKYTDASGYIAHLAPPTLSDKAFFHEKDAKAAGLTFSHKENPFNDFEAWLLNPWTLTDLGPIMAVADVNADGLDDFFIGNAFDSPSAIYLQNANGSFRETSVSVTAEDRFFEDHGGLFFDADGDKDLDLFVVGGGPDANSEAAWQCRLYLNDGKGNFSKASDALPVFKDLALRSAAHDYDGDGDLDLFIGGRLLPKKWPLTPRSVVLQNNGGKFTDVTSQVAGDFETCGMVTDLSWADLDKDGQKELVVVGEWMPLMVFKLSNGKLSNATEQFGLANTEGFWNKLTMADLDQDGDLDLVTGNLGLNTRYTATPEAPFYCFAKDFDNNGTVDPIMAYSELGKVYPLMQRDVMVKQMPILKKRFLFHKEYAKAEIWDIWPKKELNEALTLKMTTLEHCWWENTGGKFVQKSLPFQAQMAPVYGIICQDFNKDGHLDILMAGNKYGLEVETNPCNAGNGIFLAGDGKGHFTWIDNTMSGFWAMKEARDLALLKSVGGKSAILVANNSGPIQLYAY